MKFLFTADIHLSRYGQDKVEETSNLPERLHSIKETLYEMGDYCYDNDIGQFIIAGDLMHSKSIIYSIAQELMFDFFEQYEELEFWVIDGNHDLSSKGSNAISSLRSLHNVDHVEWVSSTPMGNGDNVLFVPYSHDIVNQVKNNTRKILISHFGLNEGVLNSGISIISDLSLNDLRGKYDLVLLGHYHKPQEIIRDDIKLYYVGSPTQLDWGEKGDEKRFLVVDTDTLDVQSIPTTKYRKHIELTLTEDNKAQVFKAAHEAKDAGNHVKIIQNEAVNIDDMKNDFIIIDKREADITNRGITSAMSQKDKLDKFLQIKEIPEKDLEIYLKHGIEIIDSCEGE